MFYDLCGIATKKVPGKGRFFFDGNKYSPVCVICVHLNVNKLGTFYFESANIGRPYVILRPQGPYPYREV